MNTRLDMKVHALVCPVGSRVAPAGAPGRVSAVPALPIVRHTGRRLWMAHCDCGWVAKRPSLQAAERAGAAHWQQAHAGSA